ncbi:GNAT family N-acetyltransferase [Cellulomonas sp. 179-A 4D5 NHS]|uniref:GNAT family N-acetyltransferase n=1 Tax=Cellulomonas sp. 179-A 4D5 NHS TaxID=3142378 RepID=UPI00399F1392
MTFEPMPTRLVTDRLTLTPQEPGDAGWLAALFTARGRGEVSADEAGERIRRMHALTAEHGIGALVLRPRDGGPPVGYAAVVVGRGSVEEPELAYELLPDAHGRGYATEAARAVLDAAHATGRRRVWATVRPWNAASLRVAEKLGFRRDRVTTDDDGDVVWLLHEVPAGPGDAASDRG